MNFRQFNISIWDSPEIEFRSIIRSIAEAFEFKKAILKVYSPVDKVLEIKVPHAPSNVWEEPSYDSIVASINVFGGNSIENWADSWTLTLNMNLSLSSLGIDMVYSEVSLISESILNRFSLVSMISLFLLVILSSTILYLLKKFVSDRTASALGSG